MQSFHYRLKINLQTYEIAKKFCERYNKKISTFIRELMEQLKFESGCDLLSMLKYKIVYLRLTSKQRDKLVKKYKVNDLQNFSNTICYYSNYALEKFFKLHNTSQFERQKKDKKQFLEDFHNLMQKCGKTFESFGDY